MINNPNRLREDAVTYSKTMLARVPFDTVYSYADTLFDKNASLSPGSDELATEVKFMEETKCSEIEISDAPESETGRSRSKLALTNARTGEQILCSSTGRMKEWLLEAKKEKDQDQSIYAVISSKIKSPQYSDVVEQLKSFLVSHNGMTEEHFQLFVAVLITAVNTKIKTGVIRGDLDPRKIRNDHEELFEAVWRGVDVEGIYDATGEIVSRLRQIGEKADELERRGYREAAECARTLRGTLQTQIQHVQAGSATAAECERNCDAAIEAAKQGELKNHRGFFGAIFHGLRVALHFITFGAVTVKQTDSLMEVSKAAASTSAFFSLQRSAEAAPQQSRLGEDISVRSLNYGSV